MSSHLIPREITVKVVLENLFEVKLQDNKAFYTEEGILQTIFTFQCPLGKIRRYLLFFFFTVFKVVFLTLVCPAAKQAKREMVG